MLLQATALSSLQMLMLLPVEAHEQITCPDGYLSTLS